MNVKFIFYATTLLLYVGHAAAHDYIGKGIYIPDYDLLGDDLTGGYPIFQSLSPQCVKKNYDAKLDESPHFFKDTKSFYAFIGTEHSISGEIQTDFTLGRSLDVITQHISDNKRTVRGVTQRAISVVSSDYVVQNCIYEKEFDEKLLKDFESLDERIHDPTSMSSWKPYQVFLTKYGSHVVQNVFYGASVYAYTFSDSKHEYTSEQLHMKTCASFSIPETDSVSICNKFSSSEKNSTSNMVVSEQFVARGGTDQTRHKLLHDRSDKIIAEFLSEAQNATTQPIQYKLKPIWEVLQHKYLVSEHHKKLLNMEAYYTGYRSFGCQFRVSPHEVKLQMFNYSDQSKPDYPIFQCSIVPYGCQYDRDCHYRSSVVKCDCSGDSCIKYYTHKTNTGEERTVADPFIGKGYRNDPHIGCSLRPNLKCRCRHRHDHKPRPWKVVWKSSEKHVNLLSTIHSRMQFQEVESGGPTAETSSATSRNIMDEL